METTFFLTQTTKSNFTETLEHLIRERRYLEVADGFLQFSLRSDNPDLLSIDIGYMAFGEYTEAAIPSTGRVAKAITFELVQVTSERIKVRARCWKCVDLDAEPVQTLVGWFQNLLEAIRENYGDACVEPGSPTEAEESPDTPELARGEGGEAVGQLPPEPTGGTAREWIDWMHDMARVGYNFTLREISRKSGSHTYGTIKNAHEGCSDPDCPIRRRRKRS